ncbi:hypothetical protein LPJ60_001575 [Coemansia sp. RSA 2675]|nr:hypothetical protein LPJ60_001575 [Coemansia sp. RSA 2675]
MLSTGPPPSAVSPSPGDASPDNKDDKAAPVRKRLSLACTTCRQRKVKCDGGRPSCRTCAKFNWPCIYQPSNRKRGPRPRALALMDGSIPYSSRPHWAVSHSYYTYGYPGHSPLSPPPPPPPLHFAVPHNPDLPLNGAPMQVDPARHQPGSYNHDSYSTYGDFVANTGIIRIRPPPIHSPAFNHASPTSMYMHRDTQSHHHPYHGHGYRMGHGNTHQMSAPGSFDARPTSPIPPLSAHDAPRYLDCPAPSNMAPQYSHSHRYPPHHSPMLMSPLPAGTGIASVTDSAFCQVIAPQDVPPSISSMAQHHPPRNSNWTSETPVRAQPLEAPPVLRSTPPQHMQQSHRKQHQLHSLGDIDCHAPRHASSERAVVTTCLLPFSNGVARPRLPPLSEILGKDYQIALSPNGAHTNSDTLPAFGGAAPDHFATQLSRRKDSFRDEVSKMLAHDGLH